MPGRAAYVHPVALGALGLLLLNDHVLKARYPGAVTGKVSDVAGPVVLAALLGSVAAGVSSWQRAEAAAWWAVAAAFALVKVWAPAGAVAAPLLGGPVVRDPYDVLGLLALPLAWRATRVGAARLRDSRLLRTAAAGLAVGAVTATTRAPEERVVDLQVTGTTVRAVLYDRGYGIETAETTDGLTWDYVPEPEPPRPAVAPDPVERPLACAGTHCYRVAGPGSVDESNDGGRTWAPSWRAVAGRGQGDHAATAVVFVPRTETAVVAVGRYGVLRRARYGEWTEVGVFSADPEDATRRETSFLVWAASLALVLAGALAPVLLLFAVVGVVVWLVLRRRQPAVAGDGNPWAPPPPGQWPAPWPRTPWPPPPPREWPTPWPPPPRPVAPQPAAPVSDSLYASPPPAPAPYPPPRTGRGRYRR
jgi:hypothetical protein